MCGVEIFESWENQNFLSPPVIGVLTNYRAWSVCAATDLHEPNGITKPLDR